MSAPQLPPLASRPSAAPPQVSFIIPLYNCLALTQACVASLQATLPRDLSHEIILVDDGSTDGTRAWLETLPRSGEHQRADSPDIRVLLNDRNLGYAAANNRGASIARGEFLVLLNSDLILTPRWLEPMLALHHRLGSRAGLIGNVQRTVATRAVDHSGMLINLKAKPEHDTWLPPRWLRFFLRSRLVPAVTGACALISRKLWNDLGGFDEGFLNGGEDVDLCFRARAAGRINAVALRSIVLHHVSASPGRKLRDEQNSRRLALRWRTQLEPLAYRRWCWHYLARTSAYLSAEHREARAILFYALRLRRTPPHTAVAAVHAAMDQELTRWQTLLGPLDEQ